MNTVLDRTFGRKTVPRSSSGEAVSESEFKTLPLTESATYAIRHAPLDAALGRIFPDKQEETDIQQARRIMGEEVKNITDEELGSHIAQFQHLLNSWLDEFERQIFDSQTLQQVLKEE